MKVRTVAPLSVLYHHAPVWSVSRVIPPPPIRATFLPNLILLRLITLKSAKFEGPRYVFFFSSSSSSLFFYFYLFIYFVLFRGYNSYPQLCVKQVDC